MENNESSKTILLSLTAIKTIYFFRFQIESLNTDKMTATNIVFAKKWANESD